MRRYLPGGIRDMTAARMKQAQSDAKSALDEGRRLAKSYRAERR